MLTANGCSARYTKLIGLVAVICLTVLAACSQPVAASSYVDSIPPVPTTAPAPTTAPVQSLDVLDGISFTGTYTDADVAYLRESLQLLQAKMPVWAQYVQESKPLVLIVDLPQGELGRAAIAKCCDSDKRGTITFGHHFGQLVYSTDPDSTSPEARRITFLATLVHEATHVRDQREGRFVAKTDRKSCIAAEKSGLTKQLEFQQDALTVELGNGAASTAVYQARLTQNVRVETSDLHSRAFWDQYCGAFEQ